MSRSTSWAVGSNFEMRSAKLLSRRHLCIVVVVGVVVVVVVGGCRLHGMVSAAVAVDDVGNPVK